MPGPTLSLLGKVIDLRAPSFRDDPDPPQGERGAYVVQFPDEVSSESMEVLAAYGITDVGGFPDATAVVVQMSADTALQLRADPDIYAVARFKADWKKRFADDEIDAGTDGDPLPLAVITFPGRAEAVVALVQSQPGQQRAEFNPKSCHVTVYGYAPTLPDLLLHSEDVVTVELEYPLRPLVARAAVVVGARPTPDGIPLAGLTGLGQSVAVHDTGFDFGITSPIPASFAGLTGTPRVLFPPQAPPANTYRDEDGHGSHVAGIVGNFDPAGPMGIAPDAQLVIIPMEQSVANALQGALNNGAHIFNGSYGVEWWLVNGVPTSDPKKGQGQNRCAPYNAESQSVDDFTRNHPTMTVVLAAGNEGPDPESVNTPGTAKNAITVGACRNEVPRGAAPGYKGDSPLWANQIAEFSSRGLTADNRIKPDVVAPGECILSYRSRANWFPKTGPFGAPSRIGRYWYMDGTSMATPVVSGCLALLRQWLAPTPAHPSPTSALLKALLINGAEKILNAGGWGSADQGWGRVSLENIIRPRRGVQVWWSDEAYPLHQSDVMEFQFVVVNTAAPLKVTLVWRDRSDPPVGAITNATLVNKLSLRVIGPNGHVYLGNHFGPGRHYNEPIAPGTPTSQYQGTYDTRNNVQCVILDPVYRPQCQYVPGIYRVLVTAKLVRTAVPADPQPFVLAVSGPGLAHQATNPVVLPAPAAADVQGLTAGDVLPRGVPINIGLNRPAVLPGEDWSAWFEVHRNPAGNPLTSPPANFRSNSRIGSFRGQVAVNGTSTGQWTPPPVGPAAPAGTDCWLRVRIKEVDSGAVSNWTTIGPFQLA